MSVLIRDMEIPTSCGDCKAFVCYRQWAGDVGDCFCGITKNDANAKEKNADCPLVPVPPHGRLIDGTWLNMQIQTAKEIHANEKHDFCNAFDSNGHVCTEWWCVEDMIENAPTIIPAEEGE